MFTEWLLPEQETDIHVAVGRHCLQLPTPQWNELWPDASIGVAHTATSPGDCSWAASPSSPVGQQHGVAAGAEQAQCIQAAPPPPSSPGRPPTCGPGLAAGEAPQGDDRGDRSSAAQSLFLTTAL